MFSASVAIACSCSTIHFPNDLEKGFDAADKVFRDKVQDVVVISSLTEIRGAGQTGRWQVTGDYHYQLVGSDGGWYIATATFNLGDESGTRDVFGPAAENAAANPQSYVLRQQTIAAVRAFLTSLEDKDMAKFASVWAEDAIQDMPYSPKGHPKRVVGKENLVAMYAGWPDKSGKTDFASQLVFYPMQDPETIFVEFKGDVEVIPTGRQYRQTYGGLFHVVDGKIKLFREYYDPAPFEWRLD